MLIITQTALELGFLYAPVALALFLSYRILDIADLTTDGCFVLGAAVSVSLTAAGHPFLAIPAAMLAGACAGLVTAFLQTRLGVQSIMAGIIVNTGLYTINLAVMGFSSTMSLVKTGFWPGLICFSVILGVGLLIRAGLSKLNLLLVPRISAVVIFVILIMQALAIVGYQWKWEIASSALFFPIIIMAWIIERASITWEEDGAANATKEIVYSVLVAVITYFVIVNEDIRHIMFAFNEFNLVILFVVMLLGTYTGYRLTELTRFAPLAKKDGKHV